MARRYSKSYGLKPHRVRVGERVPHGPLHLFWFDHHLERNVRRSLGHRDRDLAGQQAQEWSLALQRDQQDLRPRTLTWARLFSLYEQYRTPQKGRAERTADGRRFELFTRWFGGSQDPAKMTRRDWEGFIRARRSGEIDNRGIQASPEERKRVGDRTLEADLRWLNAVLNWATKWTLPGGGGYLMRENPARGFPVPKEKNPEQAAITQEHHEALTAVADRVTVRIARNGRWVEEPTYLRHLLVVAEGTGRRISSICALTWGDVHLREKEGCPNGWINWPKETDKQGYGWNDIPISPEVRQAFDEIQTDRPGIGATPIFPSTKNPTRPIAKDLAGKWFRAAEVLAVREFGIERMPHNRTWHGYRAKFAIETQHMPYQVRCALGGWKSDMTLRTVYDKPTAGGMLEVLEGRRRDVWGKKAG